MLVNTRHRSRATWIGRVRFVVDKRMMLWATSKMMNGVWGIWEEIWWLSPEPGKHKPRWVM